MHGSLSISLTLVFTLWSMSPSPPVLTQSRIDLGDLTTQNVSLGMEEEKEERRDEEDSYDLPFHCQVPQPKSWGRREWMDAVWWLHYISETGNSITLPLLFPLCPACLMIYLTPIFPDFYILECSHLLNIYTCRSQMHPKSWDSTDLLTLLYLFWLLSSFTRATSHPDSSFSLSSPTQMAINDQPSHQF